MKDNTVHYHHVRNTGRGKKDNYTLAIVPKPGVVYVGVAKCSRKDQFEKRKGRELAEERAYLAVTGPERWSIKLDRQVTGLLGERIKREVINLVAPELRRLNRELSK